MHDFLKKLTFAIFLLSTFNANALLIKLDFDTLNSVDMWGDVTNNFDVTQAGFLPADFTSLTETILATIQEDYYSSSYGFINSNQQLDIDFIIASVSTDVSDIDVDNYTIQIGSRVSGPYNGFGVACIGCISGPGGVAPFPTPVNTIFGSVFSNNIISGLASSAGTWDVNELANAIGGTLSHEIGHGLGIGHPGGIQSNPGDSAYGLMATGASPTNMPNSQRLLNRAFSDINMQSLVNNLGLRSLPLPIPEPSTVVLFFLAGLLLIKSLKIKQ
jgi:hypothetical protein